MGGIDHPNVEVHWVYYINHSSHFITRKLKQLVQGKHKLFWGWRGGTQIIKKTCVSWKKSTEQPISGVEELVCFLLTQCLELKRKLCFLEGTLCLGKPHFLKPHFLDTHTQQKKCSARTGGMLDCHIAHSFHGNSIHISIDFTNFQQYQLFPGAGELARSGGKRRRGGANTKSGNTYLTGGKNMEKCSLHALHSLTILVVLCLLCLPQHAPAPNRQSQSWDAAGCISRSPQLVATWEGKQWSSPTTWVCIPITLCFIPHSKRMITPVTTWLSLLIPFIIRFIACLVSGMSHQLPSCNLT